MSNEHYIAESESYADETDASQNPKAQSGELSSTMLDSNTAGLGVESVQLHPLAEEILQKACKETSTDIHMQSGEYPILRCNGKLVKAEEFPILSAAKVREIALSLMNDHHRRIFDKQGDCDLGVELPEGARFRVNVYLERGHYAVSFRLIPSHIPGFVDLGLPERVCRSLALRPRGLVLITGPTGAGKTTTLAAMVDYINSTRACKIITIEDPIEYRHINRRSLIVQREIGTDAVSFHHSLRSALRQDPDVILVGELRDLETITTALTAAETGHLVLSTLHTNSAISTIERIIDVFPPHQQTQIRLQLSMTLMGIISQLLVPATDESQLGRVLSTETLMITPGVRHMIRESKTHQISSLMETGSQLGMHTFDKDLGRLVREKKLTSEAALAVCHQPEEFKREMAAYLR